jgi:hypothetical protein
LQVQSPEDIGQDYMLSNIAFGWRGGGHFGGHFPGIINKRRKYSENLLTPSSGQGTLAS